MQLSRERRAHNRESSAALLSAMGIAFEAKNEGAHLIVRHAGRTIDFWPGTGKWKDRREVRDQRGVRKLLAHLEKAEANQPAPRPQHIRATSASTPAKVFRLHGNGAPIVNGIVILRGTRASISLHLANPGGSVVAFSILATCSTDEAREACRAMGREHGVRTAPLLGRYFAEPSRKKRQE